MGNACQRKAVESGNRNEEVRLERRRPGKKYNTRGDPKKKKNDGEEEGDNDDAEEEDGNEDGVFNKKNKKSKKKGGKGSDNESDDDFRKNDGGVSKKYGVGSLTQGKKGKKKYSDNVDHLFKEIEEPKSRKKKGKAQAGLGDDQEFAFGDEDFTLESWIRNPIPGTYEVPNSFQFSSDDKLCTYIAPTEKAAASAGRTGAAAAFIASQKVLFCLDMLTLDTRVLVTPLDEDDGKKKEATLEETLQRERKREGNNIGILSYSWASKNTQRLIIPMDDGCVYLKDAKLRGTSKPSRIAQPDPETGAPVLDARISPDGRYVAFVNKGELCVVPTGGSPDQIPKPKPLTKDARVEAGVTNGLAEYVAQEEMGRHQGYWWDPDSKLIAFVQCDASEVPLYPICHIGDDDIHYDKYVEYHHYPFSGKGNVKVKVGVAKVEGTGLTWMQLDLDDEYLARVSWLHGFVAAQIQNRSQTVLELVVCDPKSGHKQTLIRETTPVWINLHDLLVEVEEGFIWGSERTGYMHLYLYDMGGQLIRQLTEGDWCCQSIDGVDEKRGIIYVSGNFESPLERHMYSVALDGRGVIARMTEEQGVHYCYLNNRLTHFVDVCTSSKHPPEVNMRSVVDGESLKKIFKCNVSGLPPPELLTFPNRSGLALNAALYRPPREFGYGPWPCIISVYGGPQVQVVMDSWAITSDMRAQSLSQMGYLIVKVDGRGSSGRGVSFEASIRHDLGHAEVDDQLDAVRYLVKEGLADYERIGIYGWSYGGYLTVMCMEKNPGIFKVGIAGAPVTSWDGYDTHYTERYMETSNDNEEGYEQASLFSNCGSLHTDQKLLLIHGLLDENVHFRHTVRLVKALQKVKFPYDLVILPDSRHSPKKLEERIYVEYRLQKYFTDHLSRPEEVEILESTESAGSEHSSGSQFSESDGDEESEEEEPPTPKKGIKGKGKITGETKPSTPLSAPSGKPSLGKAVSSVGKSPAAASSGPAAKSVLSPKRNDKPKKPKKSADNDDE